LLVIVFAQAMRAQSLVHPDGITLAAVGGLVAGVAMLLGGIYFRSSRAGLPRNAPVTATVRPLSSDSAA
jgi:hypothetical protein